MDHWYHTMLVIIKACRTTYKPSTCSLVWVSIEEDEKQNEILQPLAMSILPLLKLSQGSRHPLGLVYS